MTALVRHHHKTCDLALFLTEGRYWIGSYSDRLSHQNSEPPYVWIRGNWDSEEEGVSVLNGLTGNEF